MQGRTNPTLDHHSNEGITIMSLSDCEILGMFYREYLRQECFFTAAQIISREVGVSLAYINQLHKKTGFYNPITLR
jgi:hypothetical protein